MQNWRKAALMISLVTLVCLMVIGTATAKGGRRGGGAGKAISSIAKGIGKVVDDFTDDNSTKYSPPISTYTPVAPPLIAKRGDSEQHGNDDIKPNIPEKLQEQINKEPGKPRYSFGSVIACVCGNNVLFTNVICTPCADGQQMVEKVVTKL